MKSIFPFSKIPSFSNTSRQDVPGYFPSLMRYTMALILVGTLLAVLPSPTMAKDSARTIMEKVDARDDGDNMTADVDMILIDKNNHERRREMKIFTKDKGVDTLKLQFFLSPADVKDTGFLTVDYYAGEKDDDQWLYLPDLHKTKRIATSDKSSSFMGSDFSYADMTDRVLDEWTYKLLKEDAIDGDKVWLIQALPASKAVEDRYGYKKSILFVRQDIFMVARAIHLLNEGKKIKYMESKKIEQIDGIWVATERWMKTTVNKRTTHRTILKWSNVKFNTPLDEAYFSIRQLEKGL
ncbi:outer membrane lipoprotein-sorting protein [Desulfocicer niacini]